MKKIKSELTSGLSLGKKEITTLNKLEAPRPPKGGDESARNLALNFILNIALNFIHKIEKIIFKIANKFEDKIERTLVSPFRGAGGLIFSFLLLSLMAFASPYSTIDTTLQDTVTPEPCFMENKVFQDGEELVYKLYYNWNFVWLAAGEVTFKVKDLGGQYHLSAVGKTYAGYEWFFKVRDYYDTYIEKNSLLPKVATRKVREGGYQLFDEITFDQQNKKVKSLRGKTQEEAREKEYEVDECMHDILSIIYYCRNIDFKNYNEGEKFPIKIFMDKEVWPLNVKYKGKQANKKVKGRGKFDTIKFSPQIISGRVFKEGEEMIVYVSDDKNQIPVLIESPVSVGSVKVVLKNHKGLRYDMEAKR